MTPEAILKEFEQAEAILKGHFVLSSGLHSDTYVQCAKVMERPEVGEKLCAELAKLWPEGPALVAGPAYGGIVVAYELARALKARSVFFERVDGKFTLRRGFAIEPGERVLVAEDVVTTGGSAAEVVECVRKLGGEVIGVASLVARGEPKGWEVDFRPLTRVQPPLWKPDDCPLCKAGNTVVRPGSRTPQKKT